MYAKRLCNLLIQLGILALIIFPPVAFGAVQPQYIMYIRLIILCISIIWVVKAFIKGSCTHIATPLDIPIPVVFILSLINFFTSASPHSTEQSIFLFLYYVVLYFLVVQQLKTARRIIGLAFIIVLIGSGESLFGIFQYLQGAETILGVPTPNIGTVNATYMSHNHFAGFLILIIPIAFGLFIGASNLEKKFFLFLLIGLMGTAFVLTLSRGGFLSFFLASGVFLICFLLKKQFSSQKGTTLLWKLALLLLLLAGFITIYITWIGISPIAHRSLSETFFPTEETLEREIRLPLWKNALALVKESPILGSGLGTFQYVFRRYRPPKIPQNKQAYHAHNDYLELLIEMGFLGLCVVLWAFFRFLRYMLHGYFQHDDSVLTPLALGGLTSCTAMGVHSFFDFNLRLPANALLMTIIMAMSVAAIQLIQQRHTRSSSSRKSPSSKKQITLYHIDVSWKFLSGVICIIAVFALNFRSHLAMIYHRQANQAHYQGQLLEPIMLIAKAITIDPYDPMFRIRLAAIYLETGHRTPHSEKWYALAVQEYENVVALNRFNPEYYILLGQAYNILGMVPQAIQAYHNAINVDPHVSTYHEYLGRYYLSMNRVELAMNAYKEAVQVNPQKMPEILRFCKRYKLTYAEYQQLIPEDAEHRKSFAALLAQQGLWQESKAEYRNALEISDGQQKYYDAMLNACRSKHDDECLRTLWRELWEQNPQQLDFPVHIVESFVSQQMWEEAITLYQELLEEHPENSELHQRFAQLYQRRGDHANALQVYQKLLPLQQADATLYHKIAAIYRQQKDWNAAITVYQKALAAGLTQAAIYGNLGELYLQQSDEKKAIAMLDHAIQTGETRLAIYKKLEYLYQGRENESALDLLWATYILANKQKPDALFQLVQHYHASGEWLKAVTLSKELISQTPSNAAYRRFLADLYEQKKMLYEAITQWEKIVNTHTQNLEFKMYLATLYEKVNQRDYAKMQYRKILRIQSNHHQAKQRLTDLGG